MLECVHTEMSAYTNGLEPAWRREVRRLSSLTPPLSRFVPHGPADHGKRLSPVALLRPPLTIVLQPAIA